jgi:hypothetical protein
MNRKKYRTVGKKDNTANLDKARIGHFEILMGLRVSFFE